MAHEASAAAAPRLGIAIITHRRIERLRHLVDRLRALTTPPFDLVVAEDGGGDGAVEWCWSAGVNVVTGDNRGVCWNKNRGLFALATLASDPILLLEDDTLPVDEGWERAWIEATRRWHHVSHAHPKLMPSILGGAGTAADPYVMRDSSALCASISAAALARVGYFDSRFKGYGIGHKEWTYRIMRSQFGFKRTTPGQGLSAKHKLYIEGGLLALDERSHADIKEIQANQALYRRIRGREPLYRAPWTDDGERDAFLAEQRAAGIAPDALADRIAKRRRLTLQRHADGPARSAAADAPAGDADDAAAAGLRRA